MNREAEYSLELRQIEAGDSDVDGSEIVRLYTDDGTVDGRYHAAESGDIAVLWVFGAGGGLGGPAGGLYPRLAEQLKPRGIASLRLDYRRPSDLIPCVLDVLLGVAFLESRRRSRIILIGHSFGGAVVIAAGAESPAVIGVAALSSQTAGTRQVAQLSPRPLLVLHGCDDEVLPDDCSRDIYARAKEPKQIRLYPGCRHGLDDCREQLDQDLMSWIETVAQGGF